VCCAGTRLVYDRAFLLECRNSPLANSPPVGLPQIPGVTCTTVSSPSQMPKNGVNPAGKHHGGHQPHGPHVTTGATHAAAPPKKPQQQPSAGICQSPVIDVSYSASHETHDDTKYLSIFERQIALTSELTRSPAKQGLADRTAKTAVSVAI